MPAKLSLIVAYSKNRTIGRDNALPWKLKQDLAHFKRSTLGHPIIMGRKTWESLGRPLPGRLNIVITRSLGYPAEGAEVVNSLAAALAVAAPAAQAFVIGGEEIYRLSLAEADEVIATEIDANVEGDAFFPELDPAQWQEVSREAAAPEEGWHYDFVTYQRQV